MTDRPAPFRIVVINDLSVPKGGASLLAIESARAFAARGHAVTLLCGDGGNPELEAEGIAIHALGQQRLLAGNPLTTMIRGLYNRQAGRMVAGWIAGNDTPGTVYHLHGWSQILSPALFAALRPVNDRLLMTAHDFFLTCPNGAMFDFQRSQPCPHRPMGAACLTTRCDRRSHAMKLWRAGRQAIQNRGIAGTGAPPPQLLIHEGMAPYFRRSGLHDADMPVLPNPVVPLVDMRVPVERNREVLFVGRIEATKGIDLAAEACRRAGVKLVAAGDGNLLEPLRRRYPEMEWAGRKAKHELPDLARRARMLVMPSRHMEPFGLSAVEALWSGIPVLSSAQSLIAPQIEAAGAGHSIDPVAVDRFAARIRMLATDDAAARRMSERARHATRHLALTPDAWIDALLAAYAALLAGGRAALADAARGWATPPSPVERQRSLSCAST